MANTIIMFGTLRAGEGELIAINACLCLCLCVCVCRNRFVHIMCVPVIFWTLFVWLSMIPIVVLFDRIYFNVSFAVAFLYIFYYILLEPVAGVSVCRGCLCVAF